MSIFDVAIIGSGPANLFAAMELANKTSLDIVILERARRLNDSRNVGNGWLGGSARSQTQMFVDPGYGGDVTSQVVINKFTTRLKNYSGQPNLKKTKPKILKRTIKMLEDNGVTLIEPTTIVMSEDKIVKLGDNLYNHLRNRCTVTHKIDVYSICKTPEGIFEIQTNNGLFQSKSLIVGLGRGGAHSLLHEIDTNLDFKFDNTQYQMGIRLEFPSSSINEMISKTNLFKMKWGEYKTLPPLDLSSVETEETNHVKISNGRNISSSKSLFCSMPLLKTFTSTQAHTDVYRLVEIANVLCDGQLLREPVGKWLDGDSILSPIPEFNSLREGLEKLVSIFPDLGKKCSVYAPEARLNAIRFELSASFETDIEGMYIVGDMSGRTHSFVQAACSGLIAAQDIINKET